MAFNYEEVAVKLKSGDGRGLTDEDVNQLLTAARSRKDGEVLYEIATTWYDERKQDTAQFLQCLNEAVEQKYEYAAVRLADEYRQGFVVPKDFQKAFDLYREVQNAEQINPEYSCGAILMKKINVGALVDEYGLDWWLFVLEHNPSRIVKACLGKWFVDKGNFERGVALLTEAAEEGVVDAMRRLVLYYESAAHKDEKLAAHWIREAEKVGVDLLAEHDEQRKSYIAVASPIDVSVAL